ncbi:CLUMA_CG013026, isoform A [Clunio marinus]|uniref:CLUMA_CG013026, isoform A n=1 Tax=Clunio marinus TaxID=568069 RepID=A0A1J1IKP5_9DIPT|nr:CLUMA_CG013026, isoform A [Clunio marinus]
MNCFHYGSVNSFKARIINYLHRHGNVSLYQHEAYIPVNYRFPQCQRQEKPEEVIPRDHFKKSHCDALFIVEKNIRKLLTPNEQTTHQRTISKLNDYRLKFFHVHHIQSYMDMSACFR